MHKLQLLQHCPPSAMWILCHTQAIFRIAKTAIARVIRWFCFRWSSEKTWKLIWSHLDAHLFLQLWQAWHQRHCTVLWNWQIVKRQNIVLMFCWSVQLSWHWFVVAALPLCCLVRSSATCLPPQLRVLTHPWAPWSPRQLSTRHNAPLAK